MRLLILCFPMLWTINNWVCHEWKCIEAPEVYGLLVRHDILDLEEKRREEITRSNWYMKKKIIKFLQTVYKMFWRTSSRKFLNEPPALTKWLFTPGEHESIHSQLGTLWTWWIAWTENETKVMIILPSPTPTLLLKFIEFCSCILFILTSKWYIRLSISVEFRFVPNEMNLKVVRFSGWLSG